MKIPYHFVIGLCAIFLVGCTSETDVQRNELDLLSGQAAIDVDTLKTSLLRGLIKNATLLDLYADVLIKQKPELADIARTLALDSSPKGPVFKGLEQRMSHLKAKPTGDLNLSQIQGLQKEARSISVAADTNLFGLMLTDPINVLADMSDGKLARVEAMSKEASAQINKAKDYGVGSQLVGNPSYGQWQQNSSGLSVWHWVGAYALLSSFNSRPTYYGDWGRNRGYSYYNDYGYSQYRSPSQRASSADLDQRTKKQFNQSGKKFQSPYAKTRQGSNTVASKSASATKSATTKSFSSRYNNRSTSSGGSKYASSSSSRRSSYSRSSRSSFGGK